LISAFRTRSRFLMLFCAVCHATAADETAGTPPESAPAADSVVKNLEDLVVTASRVETSLLDLPASAVVLTPADFGPQTNFVTDALSPVVGIRTDNRPGENLFSGFEIRGLSSNDTSGANVLIMLDGIPQRRLSYGGPYLGTLPFAAVDRMELVKGPLGSVYGRGALAGAMQLFTTPGTPEWHVNTTTSYRGDMDSYFGSIQTTGPLAGIDGGTMSFTASAKDAQGWQSHSQSEMEDYYLHLHLPFGKDDTVKFTAGWHDGRDENASPVPINASGDRILVPKGANLSIPGHNFMDMQEFRAGVAWEHRFDETFRSNLSIGYWQGTTEMFLGRPSDGPTAGTTVVNRLTQQRQWEEDSWVGQLELQKEIELNSWVTATLTVGGSVDYLTWDNTARSVRAPSATFGQGVPIDLATMIETDPSTFVYSPWDTRETSETNRGGFFRSQFDFGDEVTAFAGVRYDGYRRHQENRTTGVRSTIDESAYSPSAGILWHAYDAGGGTVGVVVNPFFSWGRGFAPIFRAVGTTEIVQIDPETSESFELGVKSEFANGTIQAEASIYQLERQDVVAYDPATASYGNFGTWRTRGVEASLAWQPVDHFRTYVNYTYRQPLVTEDPINPAIEDKDVTMVPRTITKCGFQYRPVEDWTFGMEGAYYDEAYNTVLNDVKVPGYFLLDAHVSYQWNHFKVTGFVTNLLDQDYATSYFANVNGAAFEGLPRGFGVKIEARF
jgi:iron complex outermembrane receptor protein